MSTVKAKDREKLVRAAMMSGRISGTNAMMFHQAVAHLLGLNATATRCLEVLTRVGPSTPSQIAKLTGLTTGAITLLLDRLERAHLIERKADQEDRRKTILIATKLAGKKLGDHYGPMAKAMFGFMSQYTDEELEFLDRFFSNVAEFWRDQTEKVAKRGSGK